MHGTHNVGDDAFLRRWRYDEGIGGYDGPDDRLLELLADIHHPSKAAKDVGEKSSIAFIDSERFLNDPPAEVCVRRHSQAAAASGFLKALDKCELIHPLHNFDALRGLRRKLQLPCIDRLEERRKINGGTRIEFDAAVAAGYRDFGMAESG